MARLQWGGVNDRIVELGVSKGVLYPKGKTGVIWNGLVSVSENTSGAEVIDLYADNIKYASFRSIENYEATIEAYTYPEEFAECDGSAFIGEGVKIDQQRRLPFSFCYRTEVMNGSGLVRNNGYKLHLVYNATASPSERNYETISDSPDAQTVSWDIIAQPFLYKGRRASSTIVIDSTKVDRIKLEALEDILYGLSGDDPRMPEPDEVIDLIKRTDVARTFVNILGKSGHWLWDTFNFTKDSVPIAIEKEAQRHIFYDPQPDTEYIQPSVAYLLTQETESSRKYMAIVIDEHNPSAFMDDVQETFNTADPQVTKSGDFYYYQFSIYT